jgi:hypothetical protein
MTAKQYILIICCSVKIIWATPEYFIEIDSINCTAYPKSSIWLSFKSAHLKFNPVDSTIETSMYAESYADFSYLINKKWYTNNTYGKVLAHININGSSVKESDIKIRKLNNKAYYCNLEISFVSNLKIDSLSHSNIYLNISIFYQQDHGDCTYILLPSDKPIWNKSNILERFEYLLREIRKERENDSQSQ